MATSKDYAEFVREQIRGNYFVSLRKMFGEYVLYANGKPIFLICDNTVYVKILPETSRFLSGAEKGFPYNGAKEHYILDVEDLALVEETVKILEEITPLPKKKKQNI